MPPQSSSRLMQWLQLMLLLTASSQQLVSASDDLTELSFSRNAQIDGEILAFVDFDADGWIDIISLEYSGGEGQKKHPNEQLIRLHLWLQEASAMTPSVASTSTLLSSSDFPQASGGRATIEAASVADFNGDALPDLLLSVRDTVSNSLRVWIAYGQNDRRSVGNVAMVTNAVDQPTLLDYNADLVTDFLVEVAAGITVVFCGRYMQYGFTNRTDAFPSLPPLSVPNGNLFVDLNVDLRSDLLLSVRINGDAGESADNKFVLLSPSSQAGGFQRQTGLLAFPLLPAFLLAEGFGSNASISNGSRANVAVGPPEPIAADSDAGVDLALPVCFQETVGKQSESAALTKAAWLCSNASAAVWIYSSRAGIWCRAKVDGLGSSFTLHPELPSSNQQLLRLRAADVDLDGRRDIVCLLRRLSDSALVPGLLRSISEDDATPSPADCASGASFHFQAEELPLLAACQAHISEGGPWELAAVAPAELDLDGSPDLVTLCRHPSGQTVSRMYSQVHSQPGNFFRIQALTSGRCSGPSPQSCPHGRLPQGLPAPGPCIRLAAERPSGGHRAEIACQLAQSSAHGRLPLPEVHFGLGQYSNYIERVTISVSDNVDRGEAAVSNSISYSRRQQDFSFIMPNSLLLVAPHPPDQPSRWPTWLIVRPFSHPHIWGVGLAFLLASGLAFAVAGVLQVVEYRIDRAERAAASPAGFMFDPH